MIFAEIPRFAIFSGGFPGREFLDSLYFAGFPSEQQIKTTGAGEDLGVSFQSSTRGHTDSWCARLWVEIYTMTASEYEMNDNNSSGPGAGQQPVEGTAANGSDHHLKENYENVMRISIGSLAFPPNNGGAKNGTNFQTIQPTQEDLKNLVTEVENASLNVGDKW